VVTDGQWHHVALVWDQSSHTGSLYVDRIKIAVGVQTNLSKAYGNLRVGAGRGLTATTFWSGLIDDVRIYDRAVQP
jgi:hypothetical protein